MTRIYTEAYRELVRAEESTETAAVSALVAPATGTITGRKVA